LDVIAKIAQTAKAANPDIIVFVDNCYGEFTQTQEPCQVGADLVAGSLIKNPGGGIAPTGGYIAGRRDLVELCAYRLNAPGLGKELGCTLDTPRDMYLGFYYAPGVVCEAIKTAIYAQCLLELCGKQPVPRYCDDHNDIVTCFDAGSAEALVGFCQGVQAASPVDSYAAPEPSPEPGYTDEVIMASGSFTQGSTIELSCDGPMRAPYTCYLQGGVNFAAGRAGVLLAVQKAWYRD
jgi:cystathionine beta-lyase family protein involved in aluminum resistance